MADRPLPPRLPPADSRNVLFQVFRTDQALRGLLAQAVAGTGVSAEEYGVLGVIHYCPGRTPTELAATLGIPPTTVSRHVAGFLERGLVQRAPNPDDGRSYLLSTTSAGASAVETIAPRIRHLVRRLGDASNVPLEEIAAALRALEEAAKRVATAGELATER